MATIDFRPLEEKDLPLMHQWLNSPHVAEWYGKKTLSLDEVKSKYLPRITGDDPTKAFLIVIDHKPIGYIQSYLTDNDPDLKPHVPEHSAGLDLFIGDPTFLGKGLGSEIIDAFLQKIVFQLEGIEHCIVDPFAANQRMRRVCEKLGFRYLTTIDGIEPRDIMIIDKKAV